MNWSWELCQWLSPVFQEHISLRFWILEVIITILLTFLTLDPVLICAWYFGFLIFGLFFAWKIGVFDLS